MVITTIQTITNVRDAEGELIRSSEATVWSVKPDEGKYLRDKRTGEVFFRGVCLNKAAKISNYEELPIEEEGE